MNIQLSLVYVCTVPSVIGLLGTAIKHSITYMSSRPGKHVISKGEKERIGLSVLYSWTAFCKKQGTFASK